MKLYHKQLFYIVIVFTALLLASFLLFQIESQTARFKICPEFTRGTKGVMSDMVFAIVAFILHLLCLSIWWNTIRIRVIQRGVRLYLFKKIATQSYHIISEWLFRCFDNLYTLKIVFINSIILLLIITNRKASKAISSKISSISII